MSMVAYYFYQENESKYSNITLRVGLIPNKNAEELIESNSPLLKVISEEVGINYELIVPNSYKELVEMFYTNDIDMALLGGFSFIKAMAESNASPLVVSDLDRVNRTYFIAKKERPGETNEVDGDITVESFKGKRLCFGEPMSTSGHLMPRKFLAEMNLIPENHYSSVEYSGGHHHSIDWLLNGKADICAVNSDVFYETSHSDRYLSVVWSSPIFYDHLWAAHENMDRTLFLKIQNAFIGMSHTNHEHSEALNKLGVKGYYFADSADYLDIHEAAIELEMM